MNCSLVAIVFGLIAWLAPPEQQTWRTGDAFQNRLETRLGINWVDNPLRNGLANLARSQGVAVFLDRRIDPSAKITYRADNKTLQQILEEIAGQVDAGVSIVDCVAYIGPRETAARLATLALLRKEEARRLPGSLQKRVLERKPLSWPVLATPREIVEGVVKQVGARSPDTVYFPHDLWPEGDWPPLSSIDRLTLLLAGFEMTFELVAGKHDDLTVELVKMPQVVLAAKSHRPAGDPKLAAESLAKKFPAAQFQIAQGKLEVLASAEDHEAIERILRGGSPRPREKAVGDAPAGQEPAGEKRYTLKTKEQPFQSLAKALAKNLGYEVAFDPQVAPKFAELTAIDVREATLDELLDALVLPLGLRYELDGRSLRILAK